MTTEHVDRAVDLQGEPLIQVRGGVISKESWSCGEFKVAILGLLVLALALVYAPPRAAAQQTQQTFDISQDLTAIRRTIFGGLANQIGTLPNPTGGGFTYALDPSLGVFTRSTESFGPVFANRAETTGRGKFTLDVSYSRHTFDTIDGVNLRNGDLTSVLAAPLAAKGSAVLALVDVVSIREEVTADVFTLGALYGITDRIDVGLTIPILKVRVRERVREEAAALCVFFAQNEVTCPVPIPSGIDFRSNSAESTGVGDIVLRGKYNFGQVPEAFGGRFGVAAALDVKLPSGDRGDRRKFENPTNGVDITRNPSTQQFQLGDPPLGTGIVRVRPELVASGSWFDFAPHVNVGAELGRTQGITNDLVYEVGLDYTLFGRATVSADLLGRHAFDVDRQRITREGLAGKANPDTLAGSFGIKVNPFGTLLVYLNFLIPLNNTGIRDDLTPTVGAEWSF